MPPALRWACAQVAAAVLSVRGAMVLLAAGCVAVTAVGVCALVLTAAQRNLAALDGEAHGAVQSLATAMLQLGLDQAATNVTAFFAAVAEVAAQQQLFLRAGAYDRVNASAVRALGLFAQQVLAVYDAPTTLSFIALDGSGIAVVKHPIPLWVILPSMPADNTTTVTIQYSPWHDPLAAPAVFLEMAFPNTRDLPWYKDTLQLPLGVLRWSNAFIVSDEIYLAVASRYSAHQDSTASFLTSTGCNTGWLSQLLQGLVQATGSVALLLTDAGVVVGTSHGSGIEDGSLVVAATSKNMVIRQTAVGCTGTTAARGVRATIDGRECLCGAWRIADAYGLNLELVHATPTVYFYGALQQSHAALTARALRHTRATVGLCAAVLAAAFAVAAVVAVVVTRPLQALARVMEQVGDLDLSLPAGLARPSRFAEVRRIQQQFLAMVERLREYKAFIPAGVFAGNGGQAGSSGEGSGGGDPIDDDCGDYDGAAKDDAWPRESRNPWGSTGSTGGFGDFASSRRPTGAPLRRELGLELQERIGTALVLELQGAAALLQARQLRPLLAAFGEFTEAVGTVARSGGASVDGHQGDRVFLSWNTFHPKATHRTAACRAACSLLHTALPVANRRLSAAAASSADSAVAAALDCRAGVSSGRLAWGRVGSETLRVCTVLGTAVVRAAALARHAAKCQASALAAADLVDEAGMHLHLRPCDLVQYGPGEEPAVVHELVGERQAQAGEWMYTLDDQAHADRQQQLLAKAFKLARQHDFIGVQQQLRLLAPAPADGPADPGLAVARQRLEQMARARHALPFPLYPLPAGPADCGSA